jgi:Tfp pilus assembly protein FimT
LFASSIATTSNRGVVALRNALGKRSNNQNSGFSLIEVVGVVSTVAILAVMALPGVNRSTQIFRLMAQLRTIEGELQNVRFTAINKNRPVSFLFSADGTWCFPDVDGSGTINGNEQAIWGTSGGFTLNCAVPSSPLTAANLGTTQDPTLLPNRGVAFTPRGTLVQVSSSQTPTSTRLSVPGVIYLRDGQNNYAAITLTPAGKVRSWLLNGTSWR